MHFKRQIRVEEGINLTPLIDVVFLLLIFFMVSTTFTKETHLTIDLPEASVEAGVAPVALVDIVIDAGGNYSVNGQALVNNRPETLSRAVNDVAKGSDKPPVVITADANTSHQHLVTAMDVVGRLGLSQLRITTKEPAN